MIQNLLEILLDLHFQNFFAMYTKLLRELEKHCFLEYCKPMLV